TLSGAAAPASAADGIQLANRSQRPCGNSLAFANGRRATPIWCRVGQRAACTRTGWGVPAHRRLHWRVAPAMPARYPLVDRQHLITRLGLRFGRTNGGTA